MKFDCEDRYIFIYTKKYSWDLINRLQMVVGGIYEIKKYFWNLETLNEMISENIHKENIIFTEKSACNCRLNGSGYYY